MALTVLGEDKPAELVVTSLVRAQFAEQVGLEARMGSRAPDFFLIGMLSTLDTMLGQPMEEALDRMPLPQEVRDTLLGRMTSLSPVWQLVLAYKIFRCWVSEFQSLPDLDANANAVAIQSIKLESGHHRWTIP